MPERFYGVVMALINQGLSDRKIARQLGVSKSVPEYYRKMKLLGRVVRPYKSLTAEMLKGLDVEEPELPPVKFDRRGGNNHLSQEKQEKIRELIRQGISSRQIAKIVECGKGTVMRYIGMYKHEGPICRHRMNLYLCSTCGTMRRTLLKDGTIKYKTGPHKHE